MEGKWNEEMRKLAIEIRLVVAIEQQICVDE